jgi:tRNA A37 N6-isopentenylltransferase MiaA
LDSIIKQESEIDPWKVTKIKQRTRNYAKRQLSWIRHHYDNLIIFNQNNYDEVKKLSQVFLDKKN